MNPNVGCVIASSLQFSQSPMGHRNFHEICYFFKVGACKYGDGCKTMHNRPLQGPTLLLPNKYPLPSQSDGGNPISSARMQQEFEDYYKDLFKKLSAYGEIELLNVCENKADHLAGNVYVQFREVKSAVEALEKLSKEYRDKESPKTVEFSPAVDFHKATCSQYLKGACRYPETCNYLHIRAISSKLRIELFSKYERSGIRIRSRSPNRQHRSYEGHSHGSPRHSGRRPDSRDYYESSSKRNQGGRRDGSSSRSRYHNRSHDKREYYESGSKRRNPSPIERWSPERDYYESGSRRRNASPIERWNPERDYYESGSQCYPKYD